MLSLDSCVSARWSGPCCALRCPVRRLIPLSKGLCDFSHFWLRAIDIEYQLLSVGVRHQPVMAPVTVQSKSAASHATHYSPAQTRW